MSRILICTHRASAAALSDMRGEKTRESIFASSPSPILSASRCGLSCWARWAIHKGPYSRRRIADKASGRWTSR